MLVRLDALTTDADKEFYDFFNVASVPVTIDDTEEKVK